MGNYKNQFKAFLNKHGFLPLSRWNCFELAHGKESIFDDNLEKIRKEVGKKSGIYVYKKGKRTLYVGKAVSLFGRLKDHNWESFDSAPKGKKGEAWYKFFSRNKGKLRVYWKEVKLEDDRVIIEKMLEYVLRPEFKFFKTRFEGKNK